MEIYAGLLARTGTRFIVVGAQKLAELQQAKRFHFAEARARDGRVKLIGGRRAMARDLDARPAPRVHVIG